MLIILGIIVGAVLTYLLTSNKDIGAYRRDRLERLASDLKDLQKTIDKTNRTVIDFLENPDKTETGEQGIDHEIEKIIDSMHEINLLLYIHAKSIDEKVQIYGNDIQVWINKFDETKKIDSDTTKFQFIEELQQLYNKTAESRNEVYDDIRNEIYEQFFHRRLHNWIKDKKWPWN